MIVLKVEVNVKSAKAQSIYDFMLNCTDGEYQKWWPGTHIAFHTVERYEGNEGNLVYFDEYIGSRRLKFKAVVAECIPGKKIVWQLKKIFRLPSFVCLELDDTDNGELRISHIIKAGFNGMGRIFDPLLRLYFTEKFEKEITDHADYEFTRLAEKLSMQTGNHS